MNRSGVVIMLLSKRVKEKKGQALVEFALVLPILLILVFGIIEFGRVFNAYIVVSNASREGARQAAVGNTSAKTKAEEVAASLTPKVTVNISPAIGSTKYGEKVTVTVTYKMPIVTPIIGPMISKDGNFDVISATSMRVEKE